MTAIGYIILFTVAATVTLLVIVVKHNSPVPPEEHDEREWYDGDGNHVYYDRKLIRHLARKVREAAPCRPDNSDKNEPSDESRWYDENGNHVYYDRKIIRRMREKK